MKKLKKRYSLPLWVLLGLAGVLLVAHLALPYMVRDYLNERLADMGAYRGRITDVDLAWWRGAYRINGLRIVKVDGKVPVPFVEAPLMDLAVSWQALWHNRAIVAVVVFERPGLNFVDGGADQSASQNGQGTDWREQLNKLLPITLNEVRVVEGRVSFRNFTSKPPVNLEATQVQASLYNLTNVADAQGERVARFEGQARLLGHAPLESRATFDPFKNFEDFDFKLRATGIELKRLNDFAAAYGKFDFNAGTGDLVIEAKADDGQLSGYLKPLLRNVEVFNWRQDVTEQDQSFFRSIWEALVGGGQEVLQNQAKDQFATRVELNGNVRQRNISAFKAFLGILRNAFVQALNTGFESSPATTEPATE